MTMSGRLTTTFSSGDVVDEVGVRRRLDLVLAGLDVDDEPQQRLAVVGLREPLAVQDAAALELGVGEQEAVGGDQRDRRVLGPVREHLLQHAGGRRLADRHRAGQADHERRARRLAAGRRNSSWRAVQPAGGLDVQAEQPGQRQVDLLHLVEVELVAQAPDPLDLLGGQRLLGRRRRARPRRPGRARRTASSRVAVVAPGAGGMARSWSHGYTGAAPPGAAAAGGGRPGAPLDSGPCAESWGTSVTSRRRTS